MSPIIDQQLAIHERASGTIALCLFPLWNDQKVTSVTNWWYWNVLNLMHEHIMKTYPYVILLYPTNTLNFKPNVDKYSIHGASGMWFTVIWSVSSFSQMIPWSFNVEACWVLKGWKAKQQIKRPWKHRLVQEAISNGQLENHQQVLPFHVQCVFFFFFFGGGWTFCCYIFFVCVQLSSNSSSSSFVWPLSKYKPSLPCNYSCTLDKSF